LSSSNPSPPATKRLRFRFSLRTLLIAMVVLGLAAAWVGSVANRVRKQRAIVQELKSSGADIYYDYQREVNRGGNKSRLPFGDAVLSRTVGDDVFAYVAHVSWYRTDDRTHAALALLPQLPRLTRLHIRGPHVTDDSLALIARNPQLSILEIDDAKISSAGISHLRELKQLRELFLVGNEYQDEMLSGMEQLSQVQQLRVNGTRFTPTGLVHIGKMRQLKLLDLHESLAIDDDGLAHLQGLTNLEWLKLPPTITDAGLIHLRPMQQLRRLYLDQTAITGVGISQIASLPKLQNLSLRGANIGDEGLRRIREIKSLEILDLRTTSITDEGLPQLADLSNLRVLLLVDSALTDANLQSLQTLLKLELLVVGPHTTKAAAAQLHQQLPHCTIVGHDAKGPNSFTLKAREE
jgi:Leucine-rich repeat (LRR) protein